MGWAATRRNGLARQASRSLQHDGQDRRIGHLPSQPEQPAAGRQGHAVVSEPVVRQPAITPGNPTTDQALWWQGSVADYRPSPMVAGERGLQPLGKDRSATYPCLEDSLNSAGVASNIAAQINASDPNCSCTTGGAYGNEIFISLRSGNYGPVAVSSSDGSGGASCRTTSTG